MNGDKNHALNLIRGVQITLAAFAIAWAPPAHAQTDDPALLRAYAAGYKAQFLCSGLFNGGKTVEQIERDELTGIYSEIAEIVPTLNAYIDKDTKTVSVTFADNMPPRMAIRNAVTGCTAMPIGSENGTGEWQDPQLTRLAPGELDAEKWPMGDQNVRRDVPAGMTATEQLLSGVVSNNEFGGKTSGALVVHKGQIVAEDYALGHDKHTSQRTWSVAKSMAGTYIGFVRQLTDLPLDKGTINDDPRSLITIDNLMRMASGLHSDSAGNRTDNLYMGGATVEEFATHFPLLHKPGTKFRYANNDTLIAVLKAQEFQRKAGSDVHPHQLFDKLGMTRTYAETDWQGDYILSSQVWTTARDLGRMGMLYLNNGMWNGERLLPEDWRTYVTSPTGPQPMGKFGYGATFWLMNKSDGIPADTFAAFGNRGQYLVIIPSMDMVIVRRGYDSDGSRFDIEAFTKAVVAAAQK